MNKYTCCRLGGYYNDKESAPGDAAWDSWQVSPGISLSYVKTSIFKYNLSISVERNNFMSTTSLGS